MPLSIGRLAAAAIATMALSAILPAFAQSAAKETAPPAAAFVPQDRRLSAWLFTSFRGVGEGLHLATSADEGRSRKDVGKSFLEPQVGSKLFRDPHIVRGPDVGWGTAASPMGPITLPAKDFIVLQKHGVAVGTRILVW